MALIQQFEQENSPRAGVHGPVRCTYFTFYGHNGQRYLQFNTYGSPGRKHPLVPSQTVQLDRDGMRQLAKILVETLG